MHGTRCDSGFRTQKQQVGRKYEDQNHFHISHTFQFLQNTAVKQLTSPSISSIVAEGVFIFYGIIFAK